jgi:beta-glucosidase-like glycosyl hydrolase
MDRTRRPGLGLLVPAIRLPADYGRVEDFRRLAADGVAGFLLFGGDDDLTRPFLESIREAAGRPVYIMSDTERGVGQQVHGCADLPPLMAVGATLSEERAYNHGRVTALEAKSVGINTVLAPVMDVLSLPSNPIIGNRSFGGSAELVSRLGAAWIAGAQEQGVLACAKHFPGHGHTAGDSHAELPTVAASLDELDRRELPPFRAAIAAGVGSIMTAHVRYPVLDPVHPATLSETILKDLLRENLGFGGLVISDALTMEGLLVAGEGGGRLSEAEAAVRCVQAGCDLLLHPTDPYAVAEALEEANAVGRIEISSVLARILLTLSDLAVGAVEAPGLRASHVYGAYALARDSLTVLQNRSRLLPLLPGRRRRVLCVLVDDDDDPRREAPFRERVAEFDAGFVRVASWPGNAEGRALLGAADEAEVILLAVTSSIRSCKGRANLAPGLRALVGEIQSRAGAKTVTVLFTAPGALADVEPAPATLVAAWGDAPVTVRAALDVVLSGSPLRGLDPTLAAE